jgi:hypothetical protein
VFLAFFLLSSDFFYDAMACCLVDLLHFTGTGWMPLLR